MSSSSHYTNNCNLFYSLSHVLREFNHCYGFFENASLCNYLDEELKHCLLFHHIADDDKEEMIKLIEYNLLKLNPMKYVSMALESQSMSTHLDVDAITNNNNDNDNNTLMMIKENNHKLLSLFNYYSSMQTTLVHNAPNNDDTASSSSSTETKNNLLPVSFMDHGNVAILLSQSLSSNKSSIIDALTLHSICHCIDYETNENAIKIIHQHLGKAHYDSYFDRQSLSDRAVQFSTLRLQLISIISIYLSLHSFYLHVCLIVICLI